MPETGATIMWVAAIILVAILFARRRRRPRGHRYRPGPGSVGTVYDWLNEDKRHAVEIIAEGRAEARDPEDRDGNLPDLVTPKR